MLFFFFGYGNLIKHVETVGHKYCMTLYTSIRFHASKTVNETRWANTSIDTGLNNFVVLY